MYLYRAVEEAAGFLFVFKAVGGTVGVCHHPPHRSVLGPSHPSTRPYEWILCLVSTGGRLPAVPFASRFLHGKDNQFTLLTAAYEIHRKIFAQHRGGAVVVLCCEPLAYLALAAHALSVPPSGLSAVLSSPDAA